jgi:hypothetical protein
VVILSSPCYGSWLIQFLATINISLSQIILNRTLEHAASSITPMQLARPERAIVARGQIHSGQMSTFSMQALNKEIFRK